MSRDRAVAHVLMAALAVSLLMVATAASAEPLIDYMLQCQGCHLPDGSGKPGVVPSLRDSIARFTEVPGGRAFLIQVPGSAMSPLSDEALADVLNWMIREFGPAYAVEGFRPFDAAEVRQHRASPLLDVAGVRSALVRRMRPEAVTAGGR